MTSRKRRLLSQEQFLRPHRQDFAGEVDCAYRRAGGFGDLPARGNIERFLLPVWRSCRTDQDRWTVREVIAAPLAGLDLRHRYGHHQSPAVRAAV